MSSERGADPTLIIQLAQELQSRIGLQPLVKVDAFNLPNESGIIYRILHVQAGSLTEIVRVIRAARTMKLQIRCIGNGTSLNKMIMLDDFSVLLDLKCLSDSEKIELVQVRRKDLSYINAVRVLAGVSINEFCNYQVRNQINVLTNVEQLNRTVVGSIISGANGTITKGYRSLADYVIQARILDIHGEVHTYSDLKYLGYDEKQINSNIKSVISSLGMSGIVYDVVLRYESLMTVNVDYKFETIENLLNNLSSLNDTIKSNMATQILYLPYNSVLCDEETQQANMSNWHYNNDEVIIRTFQETSQSSQSRNFLQFIDEKLINLESMLQQNELVPLILRDSHRNLKIELLDSVVQYLPWAIHSFPVLSSGCHDVTMTIPLQDIEVLGQAIRIILDKVKYYIHRDFKYPFNVGMRINFTAGTRVTLCPGTHDCSGLPEVIDNSGEDDYVDSEFGGDDVGDKIKENYDGVTTFYAHIKLQTLLSSVDWKMVSCDFMSDILRDIPSATLQWSSEWIDRPIALERIKELEKDNLPAFYKQIERMDRDGVFLNSHLQNIFYPELTSYRETYKNAQDEFICKLD